uniref:NOC3p domain-containing protein n=1 Tax=Syphacia muris TaxID=451379 RepID=A0A0N5A7P5_9BILA
MSEPAGKQEENDISSLTAADLLDKRKKMIEEAKIAISSCAYTILADPQEEIRMVKDLLAWSSGENVDLLIRDTVQKLALTSATEVFINIIPGYIIR